MPIVFETPSRKIRFQELDSEVSTDVDSCGSDVNGGDRVVAPPCFDLKDDPSFWKENNVQVLIRIRPLSSSEISLQGQNRCVRQDNCQSITWTGHPECRFTFDHVAGELIGQEDLFKVAGVPMVDNCVGGYNSCMFAYGQTGSGKTHTMLGDIEGGTRRHSVNAGMTPRVFEYLFSRIQKERETRREDKLHFVCKCSFLEIYNEHILDLLEPSSSNLQIREDARKGIYVENLTEFEVSSARDVMQQLVQGASNRKVASTNMNRASSRSHSVFTCSIESKWESQGVTHHRFARLNLVDLAGSERQKSSGAEGERLKEATNINKSLSTLGLVIMNLVSISNKKPLHVPYRDSKLTFLLQDSLGGNSKTIIIANISPSNCCALETLSTLKFAQRAKFIRNNAIINEDASGDVIAMRMQIQQLKKEVNRLQGLVNEGHDHQEGDNMNFTMIDSPGFFKWNEGSGTFTPLTSNKKISQRKDYETVLVAAIRRDQDKDKALHALIAEKQATEQLASQRSDEVQGLKMRLRFREERIKRLEAVSLGKLSAETHLLKEKEELSKEIEHLRNHVDRNREATRFAMENLQLKEELRRLQSFVEEGERDMMNQQITLLQDKLLEALDWKLMHEKDTDNIQGSLDFSSTNEEVEFLHLQAIQNQREVDVLRKNLSICLEMKEKLERKVDELTLQLEEQRKPMTTDGSQLVGSIADVSSDQFELKAMVEAIASASQREAEAHETTITLAKENEELRAKLKVLIDDNNKLIELCENLSGGAGNSSNVMSCQNNGLSELVPESHLVDKSEVENSRQGLHEMREENEKLITLYEQSMRDRDAAIKNIEHLEQQVQEMHKENGKLIDLYEQSMHERNVEKKNIECLEQQLQEMHEENDKLMCLYEEAMQERDIKTMELKALEFQLQELHRETEKLVSFKDSNNLKNQEEICCPEELVEVNYVRPYCNDDDQHDSCETKTDSSRLGEHLDLVQSKLDIVQENFQNAFKVIDALSFVEKETKELLIIADKLETMYLTVQLKQQEIASLRFSLSVMQDRRVNIDKKLLTFQDHYLKMQSLEDLELQARAGVDASSVLVERKKEELSSIRTHKQKLDAACLEATDLDAQLREKLNSLKLKYQQMESQKRETEKVLFAIDNLEKKDNRTLHFGKASELLKSEEERTKLSSEIKRSRERLVALEKEISSYKKDIKASDAKILDLEAEVKSGIILLEVCGNNLEKTIMYKKHFQPLYDECCDVVKLLLDFQEVWFECNLKESEIHAYVEELKSHMEELEGLKTSRNLLVGECERLLKDTSKDIQHVGEMVDGEFEYIHRIVNEAKSLISSSCTKESSAGLLPEISLEAPVPSVELSCPTLDVASCPSITDFIMSAEPQVELAEDPFVDKVEATKDIKQLKNAHCNPSLQTQHLISGGENHATEAHATCRESSTCLLQEISPEAPVAENVNCIPVSSVELSCPTLDVVSCLSIMSAKPQGELSEDPFVHKEEEVTESIKQLNAHCNPSVQAQHLMAKPIGGGENHATEAQAAQQSSSKRSILEKETPSFDLKENVGIMCRDCTKVQVEETEKGMARKLGRATMEEMRFWSMRKLRRELQAFSLEGRQNEGSTNKNDRRTALATLNENCLDHNPEF